MRNITSSGVPRQNLTLGQEGIIRGLNLPYSQEHDDEVIINPMKYKDVQNKGDE